MNTSSPGMNNKRPQSYRFPSQRYLGRGDRGLADDDAAGSTMRLDAIKASSSVPSLDRPYDVNVDIDDIRSPTLSGEDRLCHRRRLHRDNGQMRRRFSITMYNLGDVEDIDHGGGEGNDGEFVDADEYESSHRDEDNEDDEDHYGYLNESKDQMQGSNVVADGTNLNIGRTSSSYFDNQDDCYDPPKRPNGRILIHQPSSARILDMELPSPPLLRSKKAVQPVFSDDSRPSSCSSLLTSKNAATHVHPQKNDRVVTEKKSARSNLSSLKPPRPSSSIWNLLGSHGKAKKPSTKKTEVDSIKPRSERTSLPHCLPDLPFGVDKDEDQEHQQTPRSFDRRNSITAYNLQDLLDKDGNDERSKYGSSKGSPAVIRRQQTQSVRSDRSSSYDRQLKRQTEAKRRCKSQRDDRKVNEAKSDRGLSRRATNTKQKKKKSLPPTPPRRERYDGDSVIDEKPCLKPVAVNRLKALAAGPSKACPLPFSFSSPPTNKAKTDNRLSSSSNYHNHHQSRRGAMNTSRRNELVSPPRVKSSRPSPSVPPSSPLTILDPTRDDLDNDDGDRYGSTKMFSMLKNSFRKSQMTLERSSSTRSFGSRAA